MLYEPFLCHACEWCWVRILFCWCWMNEMHTDEAHGCIINPSIPRICMKFGLLCVAEWCCWNTNAMLFDWVCWKFVLLMKLHELPCQNPKGLWWIQKLWAGWSLHCSIGWEPMRTFRSLPQCTAVSISETRNYTNATLLTSCLTICHASCSCSSQLFIHLP